MPSARLNRGIVEPDKHRTAVLCILDSLLPPARRVILSDGGAGRVEQHVVDAVVTVQQGEAVGFQQ